MSHRASYGKNLESSRRACGAPTTHSARTCARNLPPKGGARQRRAEATCGTPFGSRVSPMSSEQTVTYVSGPDIVVNEGCRNRSQPLTRERISFILNGITSLHGVVAWRG